MATHASVYCVELLCNTSVAACQVDICFVVDYSGSIRDTNPPGVDNWQLVINFMVKVVSDINIGPTTTRVGVVSFGEYLKHGLFADTDEAVNIRRDYSRYTTPTNGGI